MTSSAVSNPDAILLCTRCHTTFSLAQNFHAQAQETFDRLRAHYYPTPSENNEITLHIEEARNSLTEFARLKGSLEKMERSRANRKKYIDRLASLQAPARRLPTEILLKIFHYVVSPKEKWNLLTKDRQPACFNLASVSVRWRDIALSSKELWAFIGVDIHVGFDINNPTSSLEMDQVLFMTAALQNCISRSDSAPLSIWLPARESYSFRSRHEPCPKHLILALLASHARRWREVDLRIEHKFLQPVSGLTGIEGNLPILERLAIPFCGHSNLHPTQFFGACPRLSNVTIVCGTHGMPLLPFHQLTTLRVEKCRPSQLLEFLNSCPQLTSLHVDYPDLEDDGWDTDDGLPPPQYSPVSFNLRSLSICVAFWHFDYPKWIAIICNSITLPFLESISISAATYDHDMDTVKWSPEPFQSFLERSSCPLQKLTIELIPLHSSAMINVLGAVPTLTHLRICEPPKNSGIIVTNTLLQSLT